MSNGVWIGLGLLAIGIIMAGFVMYQIGRKDNGNG